MKKKRSTIALVCTLPILVLCIFMYSMLTWKSDMEEDRSVTTSNITLKLKDALIGDGVIVLSASEVNGLVDIYVKGNKKLNESIKDAYINIVDDKIQANAVYMFLGQDLYVKSLMKPRMVDGKVNILIESVSVGKLTIPQRVVLFIAERYMPKQYKILADGSIELGSRILNIDVGELSIGEDKVRIVLKQDDFASHIPSSTANKPLSVSPTANITPSVSTPTPTQAIKDTNKVTAAPSAKPTATPTKAPTIVPTPTPTSVPSDLEKTIAALKATNSQMGAMLNDMKNDQAKRWVSSVIAVNSKMIGDPSGNYSSDINGAKTEYAKLPAQARDEIKQSAIRNMDVASVRYLVKVYGIM